MKDEGIYICKIAVIAGLTPENAENNWEFIQNLGTLMSKGNNDGLGYSAVTPTGEMFGERWLFNDEAFDVRKNMGDYLEKFKGFLKGNPMPRYSKFGEFNEAISAITLHTRFATSEKGLPNTHPFIELSQDTSLIHNGVIQNVTEADNIRSTCDSERILNRYLAHDIRNFPDRIQEMTNDLKGNFACGVISKTNEGQRFVDVFRTRANLSAAYIKELGALVITTDITLVNAVCNKYNFTVVSRFEIEENMLIRLDAITGEPIFGSKYLDNSRPYDYSRESNVGYLHSKGNRNKTSEADLQKPEYKDAIDRLISKQLETAKGTAKTYDPLNETEANKDGYVHTKDGVWVKRKTLIN